MAIKTNNYDLGENYSIGLDKKTVDDLFTSLPTAIGSTCLVCGRPAQYRLIPKQPEYNTAEIQTKGYICGHCLLVNNNIRKEHYGIKEL